MVFLTLHKAGVVNVQVGFPDKWDELTTEELLAVCRLQLASHATPVAARMAIFIELLKMRCVGHTSLPLNFTSLLNFDDAAATGYNLVDFLYNTNNRTLQPHKEIVLPGHEEKMIGPGDNFDSLTCGEFEDTEIFFNRFVNQPAQEPLASLAAVLYRPAKYITLDNDGRPVRYDYKVTYDAFLQLEPAILYSIFTWYVGCRSNLPKYFPTVYKGGEGEQAEPDLVAFTKCIHAGAGEKNGSRVDIRLMLLKEFLFDMEQEAIHSEKLKEQYEQR